MSRKQTVLLNQRKLKGIPKRDNHGRALSLLQECYPHLSLSTEQLDFFEEAVATWNYETLSNILYTESKKCYGDGIVIIDGIFISSVMDRLQCSCNSILITLHLLKLSVDGVQHNRKILESASGSSSLENDDINALRQIYKGVISVLGRAHNVSDASVTRLLLNLLHHHMLCVGEIKPEPEIYHAILNSLGRCGASDAVFHIIRGMELSVERAELIQSQNSSDKDANMTHIHQYYPPVDQMAYQTAISSLSKHGDIEAAISILYRMKSKGFSPDTNCYNVLLIGIAKEAGRANSAKSNDGNFNWHKVALQILQEMEAQGLRPTEQERNSVIAACGREGAWNEAAYVEKKDSILNGRATFSSHDLKRDCKTGNTVTDSFRNTLDAYFKDLEHFRKFGKGEDSWWEIGRYNRDNAPAIIIGISPHRNPIRNGISLVFYNENGLKLGRMLLKNSSTSMPDPVSYSCIVGMEVKHSERGQGLSKLFVAIWLKICLATNSYPRAAVMNKPLISLVLMHFGFIPQRGGTCVKLIRLDDNQKFGLYSTSKKSLQGVFSQRVLRSQNILILTHNVPQGKVSTVYIKTTFEHPIAIVDHAVDFEPPIDMEQELRRVVENVTTRDGSVEDTEYRGDFQRKFLEVQLQDIFEKGKLSFAASIDDLQCAFRTFIRTS